jgi:hypothetical protein
VALALGSGEGGQRLDWLAVWMVHVVVHLGKMPNRRKRSCGRMAVLTRMATLMLMAVLMVNV